MKKLITLTFAFAASLSLVLAEDEAEKGKAKGKGKGKGGDPAAMFAKVDKDANGTISLDEWKAGPASKAVAAGKTEQVEKAFAKMAGEDGALTLEELKAAREARAKAKAKSKAKGKGKGKGKGDGEGGEAAE